jgi:hypothetical protein
MRTTSLSGTLNLSRAKQALRSVLAGRPGPAWARPPIADPADAVVLVIVPSAQHRDGHSAGARGRLRRVAGRLLAQRSSQPFLDAARILMGEGVHPDTVMVMRHAGSNADSLIAKVSMG